MMTVGTMKLLVSYADVQYYYYLSCMIMYYLIERKINYFILFIYFTSFTYRQPWMKWTKPGQGWATTAGAGDSGREQKGDKFYFFLIFSLSYNPFSHSQAFFLVYSF